ncbi:MAG TPA: hypothetical protein VJG64_02915 [Candidatus Paceibacterota bacterium]
MAIRKISLNELGAYSPWIRRLKEGKKLFEKTPASLMREYNEDKYAPLMACKTFVDAIQAYRGPKEETAYSRHGELFVDDKDAVYELRQKIMLEALRPTLEMVEMVIELGAGFGQTVRSIQEAYPALAYRAGEYTPNGVALGQKLLPGVQFYPFNFYKAGDWDRIFDGVENALVFTVHAVEMIPDATLFVREVQRQKNKIHSVVNFEPIYRDDGTELSRYRMKYIEINSYCQNILQSILNPRKIEEDFFGVNPLFPKTFIEWDLHS